MSRILIVISGIVGVLALIIIVVAVFGVGRTPASPTPVTLQIWGIQDDEEEWAGVFAGFKEKFPSVTLSYRRFDEQSYEEMLINRLAEGRGPDIFMAPHTWIAMHRDKLFPLPQSVYQFSTIDFTRAFVDEAAEELITDKGEILGMPIFIDTLALFYNKDMLNAAGIAEPPKTWDDVAASTRVLTRVRPAGDIERAGIALGTSKNVAHSFEILSAMMGQESPVQRGGRAQDVLGAGAGSAMARYVSYADPSQKNFSWGNGLPDSLDAFAQGNAAMMIGFSADSARIRSRNPHLNFGIAPLPQLAGAANVSNWGDYFFPAVSQASVNRVAAWQFILFVGAGDGATAYLDATHRPPARRDLISVGTKSGDLSVFVPQSLAARSWPVPNEGASRRLFTEAIDSAVSRAQTPQEAVRRLQDQLRLLAR